MKKRFLPCMLSLVLSATILFADVTPAFAQGMLQNTNDEETLELNPENENQSNLENEEVSFDETSENEDKETENDSEIEEKSDKETENDSEIEEKSEEETEQDSEIEENDSEELENTEEIPSEIIEEEPLDTSELQKKAKEELGKLISEVDIAALIYLSDYYDVLQKASINSKTVITLEMGSTVYIQDIETDEFGNIWYKIKYFTEEAEYTGYVLRDYLVSGSWDFAEWEEKYLSAFLSDGVEQETRNKETDVYADVKKFPYSYQKKLTDLKTKHTNWTFVPFNTGLTLDAAVEGEFVGDRCLVPSNSVLRENDVQVQPGWCKASKAGIKQYLDPRNFFTEDKIFQFELLTYNKDNANLNVIEQIVSGTFMANECPGTGTRYANVILQAGIESKANPYHLAARLRQEQGTQGTSPIISGKYSGYEGYYNFFNIDAYGSTKDAIYQRGLKFAKEQGWDNRYKSIVGGSSFLKKRYIDVGQDTLYLQKFDFVGDFYTHQYMQNLLAPYNEANTMKNAYVASNNLSKPYVFKIPVFYEAMSIKADKKEMEYHSENQVTISAGGSAFEASDFIFSSSDETLATVDETGKVLSFEKAGTVTISAKYVGTITAYKNKVLSVKINILGININNAQDAIRRGTVLNVDMVSILPSSMKTKTIYYTSSDEEIMTVSTKGVLTAKKVGEVKIKAYCKDEKYVDEKTFYVIPYGFELKDFNLILNKTDSYTINPVFDDLDMTDLENWPERIKEATGISFISSDSQVLSVSDEGVITPVSCGLATVTVKMDCGFAKDIKVNVKATVSLKSEGNEDLLISVPYKTNVTYIPEAASAEGKHFAGWFTEENGQGNRLDSTTIIMGDQAFYAYFVESAEDFVVAPIGEQIYTGKALKPEIRVYDGALTLVQGKDYTVEYSKNTTVGTAVVKVKGKGNYSGTQTANFAIVPKNLTGLDIISYAEPAKYNKKVIKTKPAVIYNGKKLALKKDYILEYNQENAYKEPGTYEITVKGIGNYTGTLIVPMEITENIPASKLTLSSIPNQAYSGKDICPSISVKYGSKVLSEGVDYLIEYKDNQEIGKATVTVKGIGKYYGEKSKTFNITGVKISGAKFTGIVSSYEYSGNKVLQKEVEVTYKGEKLVENQDYSVSYLKETNAGKATIIFTGIHKYYGTVKKTYTIKPHDFTSDSEDTFTIGEIPNVAYIQSGCKPKPQVFYKQTLLAEGKDYTLSYKNNKVVTKQDTLEELRPTVIIKGKGNFKGTKNVNFVIVNGSEVNISAKDIVYKKKANNYKNTVAATDLENKALKAGVFYDKNFVYKANSDIILENGAVIKKDELIPEGAILPAGSEVKVSVYFLNQYQGISKDTTYRIVSKDISGAKVVVANQIYSGKSLMPAPDSVSFSSTEVLNANEDYEIVLSSYKDNVNKGTATFMIRGKGNYGGTKIVKFKIVNKTLLPFRIFGK